MDNSTRGDLPPSGYTKPEHVTEMGRIRRFYQNNKESILITAVVVLGVKNMVLRSENRHLAKKIRDNKDFIEKSKVQLEALALFDQAFGPRRIHSKHT